MILTETPKRYKKATLKSDKATDITSIVRSIFEPGAYKNGKSQSCLIIIGVPGCGKTYALWALKNDMDQKPELIDREVDGDRITYVNASKRRVSVIDASWFTEYPFMSFEAKDEEVRRIKEADVLCIDDLGMEAEGERNAALVESIINTRYNEERTTIITTNLGREELKKRYSERIIDRLREWGIFFESKVASHRPLLRAV